MLVMVGEADGYLYWIGGLLSERRSLSEKMRGVRAVPRVGFFMSIHVHACRSVFGNREPFASSNSPETGRGISAISRKVLFTKEIVCPAEIIIEYKASCTGRLYQTTYKGLSR